MIKEFIILMLLAPSVLAEEKPVCLEIPVYKNGKLVEKHYLYPDNQENNQRLRNSGPVLMRVEYDKRGSHVYYSYPERLKK